MSLANRTRSSFGCPIFGPPADLKVSQLPTIADIIKCYLFVRLQLKIDAREPESSAIIKQIAEKVISIWKSASLPILSTQRIHELIKKLHDEYRKKINLFGPLFHSSWLPIAETLYIYRFKQSNL